MNYYNVRAAGYDFTGRADVRALCTMAVNSARTGNLCFRADGYEFLGNHDFGGEPLGEYPLVPRAMIQMALDTVRSGNLTLRAAGYDYTCQSRARALVKILVTAIEENVRISPKIADGPGPR